jgi:nitrate reductase NapE
MINAAGHEEDAPAAGEASAATRYREWALFLFLTVILAPALSVAVVGGYGFIIWMFQLIAGPPGPPSH